jgi:hypothetical protein
MRIADDSPNAVLCSMAGSISTRDHETGEAGALLSGFRVGTWSPILCLYSQRLNVLNPIPRMLHQSFIFMPLRRNSRTSWRFASSGIRFRCVGSKNRESVSMSHSSIGLMEKFSHMESICIIRGFRLRLHFKDHFKDHFKGHIYFDV